MASFLAASAPASCAAPRPAPVMTLHAAGGLGQARDLAGPLGGPRGEERVDVLQLEARVLHHLPDHGGDAELEVVVADHVDHLPVLVRQPPEAFLVGEVLGHRLAPQPGVLEEPVLVQVHRLAFELDRWHLVSPFAERSPVDPHPGAGRHGPEDVAVEVLLAYGQTGLLEEPFPADPADPVSDALVPPRA